MNQATSRDQTTDLGGHGACVGTERAVCVYYCRTYDKAVRCGTREEPGTSTQGAPVFPGSSRLGIEPKTPGWLVQDPTTRTIGDLIPQSGDLEPTFGVWTLECVFRGNVGIHRAPKSIQVDGIRPRRVSLLGFPCSSLSGTFASYGASAVARTSGRGHVTEA